MAERDLGRLLAGLDPRLDPTPWVFLCLAHAPCGGLAPLMTFIEDEGVTCILPTEIARELGQPDAPVFQRIVLGAVSDLEAVGLTAAVAGALTEAGISANVVAAFHHDHIFVPAAHAAAALACLEGLRG